MAYENVQKPKSAVPDFLREIASQGVAVLQVPTDVEETSSVVPEACQCVASTHI